MPIDATALVQTSLEGEIVIREQTRAWGSPRCLTRPISRLLVKYYRGADHPAKMRIWSWVRYLTRHSRIIVSYPTKGGWICVDERDLIDRAILSTGSYELEVWNALSPLLTPGEVIWDVGAHVGSFSVRVVNDERIDYLYAFEPDLSTFQVLEANMRLNRGTYQLHNVGLSNRWEWRTLSRGPLANTGLSTLVNTPLLRRERFNVRCETGDSLVYEQSVRPPSVIKIDVEGWEVKVLEGAVRILRERPPKVIIMEAEVTSEGALLDKSIAQLLSHHGYHIQRIQRPSNIVEPRENFLCTKRQSTECCWG